MKPILYTFLYLVLSPLLTAQTAHLPVQSKGHSHNDYVQSQPFTAAFEARMASIEADIFLWRNDLYVAHTFWDIDFECTFEAMYLQPIVFAVRSGTAYPMQFLIDVKSFSESTLNLISQQLMRYPDVFNDNSLVSIVISGNRPDPSVWHRYPAFIRFDGRPDERYTDEQWQRIALVSDNFSHYTGWFGTHTLTEGVCHKLKKVIDAIHTRGKKIRFWKTPDTEIDWERLINLGADFINTDHPYRFSAYFNQRQETLSVSLSSKK
jgi:alkaline phosphatase